VFAKVKSTVGQRWKNPQTISFVIVLTNGKYCRGGKEFGHCENRYDREQNTGKHQKLNGTDGGISNPIQSNHDNTSDSFLSANVDILSKLTVFIDSE
jgi:hypothetical protein